MDSLLLYHVEAPRSVTIVIVISCQCDPSVSRHSDEQQQRKPNHCDTLYPISRCSFHLPCGLTALTKKTKVGFPRLTERREDRPEKPDRRDLGYRPRQSPFKRKITTHRTSRSARSRPKYPPSSHPRHETQDHALRRRSRPARERQYTSSDVKVPSLLSHGHAAREDLIGKDCPS